MKFGLVVVVTLALGAVAASFLLQDNGYVLINFHGYARQITRGYIEVAEGNFAKGEKLLTRGVRESETPLLNYLAAARAAQLQGDLERRDSWLTMAYEQEPGAASAILLTQAELQISNNELEAALATLQQLREMSPRNAEALKLLAELYWMQ